MIELPGGLASVADFVLAMVVTNPERGPHERASMICIERGTPGMHIIRDVHTMDHPWPGPGDHHSGGHAEIVFEHCRVPRENLIGKPGEGFLLAQKRLTGGRIHHAMRWIGQSQRAFDMMCERAVSRTLHGRPWATSSSSRTSSPSRAPRSTPPDCSRSTPPGTGTPTAPTRAVLYNVIDRAIQVHGALGFSTDLPLERMYRLARNYRISDGADEVHKNFIARSVLKSYAPVKGPPSEHVPTRTAAAEARFAHLLDLATANA